MHALLIARDDGQVIQRIELDPKRAYSIGRSPRCDIALKPGSISRRHALLVPHAGHWLLLDTGSRRGLRTADGDVRRAELADSGWVALGRLVLCLDSIPGGEAEDSGVRRLNFHDAFGGRINLESEELAGETIADVEFEPGAPATGPLGNIAHRWKKATPPAGPTAIEAPADAPLLVVERADGTVHGLFHFGTCQHATVGYDPACHVVLPCHPGVAPLHLVFYREPRTWVAVDAGGGMHANGRRYVRKRLGPNDVLETGPFRFRIVRPTVLAPKGSPEASNLPEATFGGGSSGPVAARA